MPQHAAPLAVDRAVAFVGDHQIEVARRKRAVLRDHGLQGRDGDALGAVEAAAGAQHVAGIIPQMVGERVLGLPGQGDPIDQEQHAGDDARLEQPLDEGCRRAGLAGPRRHLDQQLPPAARDFGGQRLDAFDLVVAVDDLPVDGDRRRVAAHPARGDPSFEVVLRVEACDRACVGVRLPIQEPHFLAVRKEDERDAELLGVMSSLVLRRDRIDARPLGLQHRHGPALPVAEHVVGQRAVGQRVLEQDARSVGEVPARVLEQGVDPDACEGFGRTAHVVPESTASMPIYTSSSSISDAEFMQ